MKCLLLLILVSSIGLALTGCNSGCLSDSSCNGPCPYCKRITVTNWQCRADTCSMVCTSSSQCKGSCSVCFAAKCQECQADSHCVATFGSAKPFCKRITAINRECRADTCSMFCRSSSECKGSCSKCRWFKCKSSGSGSCFPGQSQVVLEGGKVRRMEDLRIGDAILTVENEDLVSTKVLGFLDKRINQTSDYLNLAVEGGRNLFISWTHAMFIKGDDNTVKSILAKDAALGDVVFLQDGNTISSSQIIDISVEQKRGAYVPLTDAGTLLVDGILVSCYTNTDHWLAHAALAPLRWWPTLLLDTEKTQDLDGLRTIPGLIRTLGRMLGLIMPASSTSTIQEFETLTEDLTGSKVSNDIAQVASRISGYSEL